MGAPPPHYCDRWLVLRLCGGPLLLRTFFGARRWWDDKTCREKRKSVGTSGEEPVSKPRNSTGDKYNRWYPVGDIVDQHSAFSREWINRIGSPILLVSRPNSSGDERLKGSWTNKVQASAMNIQDTKFRGEGTIQAIHPINTVVVPDQFLLLYIYIYIYIAL